MKNSFRFFSNKECEYFPCHKVENPEEFNCLFCYCPLYFLKDCGGDFTMRGRIKDCTNCLRPHLPQNYDIILARLKREFDTLRKG